MNTPSATPLLIRILSLCALGALGLMVSPAAQAQTVTLTFETATVPHAGSTASPSTADAASSLAAAFGGTDTQGTVTIQGVTFDNRNATAGGGFTVFRNTYTNGVSGTNLYGPTSGVLALTNAVNPIPVGSFATPPDTGPGDAGPDGLIFATNSTLTSLKVGTVDYGDGNTGASQITITAFGASGDLTSVTSSILTTSLNTLDTGAFITFQPQITGYRINRTLGSSGYAALGGGGNYVLDDLTFTTLAATPEPASWTGMVTGALGLLALGLRARSRRVNTTR